MKLNQYYYEKDVQAAKSQQFRQSQESFNLQQQQNSTNRLRSSQQVDQDQKEIESLSPSRNLSTQGEVIDQDQIVEQEQFQDSQRQEENSSLKDINHQDQLYQQQPQTKQMYNEGNQIVNAARAQYNFERKSITQQQIQQQLLNGNEQQQTQQDLNSKQTNTGNLSSRNFYNNNNNNINNQQLSNNSQFANSQYSCNPSTARIANITPSRMFVYPQQTFPTGASVHSSTQNYQKLVQNHHHHGPSRSTSTRAIEQLSQAIAYQLQAENNNNLRSSQITNSQRQKPQSEQHQLEEQLNPLTNKLMNSNYSSADNKRRGAEPPAQNTTLRQSVNEDQFMVQMANFQHKMWAVLGKKDDQQCKMQNLQEKNEIHQFQLSPQPNTEFKRDNNTRVGVLRYDNLEQVQYQRSGVTIDQQNNSNLYKDSQIASPRQLANSITSSSQTQINEFNALSQGEKQELLRRIAKFSNH